MSNDISNNSYLDSLRRVETPATQQNKKNDALTQEDFFALLTQQLSYQDPSKPADNDQMIAQMTNFSMADGINKLNTNFESLASSMTSNSALQASTLVGKDALVPSDVLEARSGKMAKGSVNLPQAAQDVVVRISDSNGQLVQTINLGNQAGGDVKFSWNGLDANGNPMPVGNYTIQAEGRMAGEYTSFETATYKNIESVSINGPKGVVLNTSTGSVNLADVSEIAQS